MIAHKLSILELAAYYEKSLTDQQVKIYSEQLADALTDEEVMLAVKLYYNDPKNEFFPRPVSKLIALVKKPIDNKDQAQNVVNLIKKAVVNHQSRWVEGYFNHYDNSRQPVWVFYNLKGEIFDSWKEAAKSEIGELGLTLVDQLGGWKRVCERFDQEPEGVVTGQVLRNAESVMNIAEVGKLNEPPSLPEISSLKILNLVKIKQIE